VDWAVDAEPVVPWYGQRNGKDGVGSLFADLASSTEVQDFAVEGIGARRQRGSLSCASPFA
jgi:hypothetical protein